MCSLYYSGVLNFNYELLKLVIASIFELYKTSKTFIFVHNLIRVRLHTGYFHFEQNHGPPNVDLKIPGDP